MIFADIRTAKTKQMANLILFDTQMTRKTWQNVFPHFNVIFPNKVLTTQSWIYCINWTVIVFVSSKSIHFVNTIQHQYVTRVTMFQKSYMCPHVGSHLNEKNISNTDLLKKCLYSLWWVFICVFKLLFWAKSLLQTVHTNGFSPVWVLMCIARWAFDWKNFPQIMHWWADGLKSPGVSMFDKTTAIFEYPETTQVNF